MTNNLQVVAFDWDNTLALTRETLVNSVNEVLQKYQLPVWEQIKEKCNPMLSFTDNLAVIFGQNAEEAYRLYSEAYRRNMKQYTKQPEGVMPFLVELQHRGIKAVIVTNKHRDLLHDECALLYDENVFAAIVCGHEAVRNKPAADPLLKAVSGLVDKITPQTVWMVGDTAADSLCALAAGARAVRIGKPIWGDEDETMEENVIYVENFSKLCDLLIKGDEFADKKTFA